VDDIRILEHPAVRMFAVTLLYVMCARLVWAIICRQQGTFKWALGMVAILMVCLSLMVQGNALILPQIGYEPWGQDLAERQGTWANHVQVATQDIFLYATFLLLRGRLGRTGAAVKD
jgi:hypothetical protein